MKNILKLYFWFYLWLISNLRATRHRFLRSQTFGTPFVHFIAKNELDLDPSHFPGGFDTSMTSLLKGSWWSPYIFLLSVSYLVSVSLLQSAVIEFSSCKGLLSPTIRSNCEDTLVQLVTRMFSMVYRNISVFFEANYASLTCFNIWNTCYLSWTFITKNGLETS